MATEQKSAESEAEDYEARPPETEEQQQVRHWLRRWLTKSLRGAVRPNNLHVREDGSATIAQLVGIARSEAQAEGVTPSLITSEAMTAAVETSGGAFSIAKDRVFVKAKPLVEAKPRTEAEMLKDDEGEMRALLVERQAKIDAQHDRARSFMRSSADSAATAAIVRGEAEKKTLAQANKAALQDPKNLRRIADPNDHSKLASIAPAMKKIQE